MERLEGEPSGFIDAFTELAKARAANKGINNLRIKKEGFIPSILDRLSISFNLSEKTKELRME